MCSKTGRAKVEMPAFSSGADYMCAVNACLRENQHFIKKIIPIPYIPRRHLFFLTGHTVSNVYWVLSVDGIMLRNQLPQRR
jgi:hypothetical protein